MKILLDENLPVELKNEFIDTSFDVFSVRDMKWDGIKNGELLQKLVTNKFDAFIMIDKNLERQQNVSKFPLSIFVLNAFNNKIQTLIPFINRVKKILKSNVTEGIIKVNLK